MGLKRMDRVVESGRAKTLKILFSVNSVWNLVNFRAGLILALVQAGYEVVAVAPPDEHVSRLRSVVGISKCRWTIEGPTPCATRCC
jgi:hypothetical protein